MASIEDYFRSNLENTFSPVEYLKTILKLNASEIVPILQAFTYYMSSNKNYKYNITNILDQIEGFTRTVKILKKKKKLYEEIKRELEETLSEEEKEKISTIVFDKCFLCYVNPEKEIDFVGNLEMFSLRDISKTSVYLQFCLEEGLLTEEFSYSLWCKDDKDDSKVKKNLKGTVLSKIKANLEEYSDHE